MTIRTMGWRGARALAGILSGFVSLHGVYAARGVDFRADAVLTALYCLLPMLSFPVFIFVRSQRFEIALQTGLALGYLTTYTMLNWRTCAELGYCGTVAATVFETVRVHSVEAALGVIMACAVAQALKGNVK